MEGGFFFMGNRAKKAAVCCNCYQKEVDLLRHNCALAHQSRCLCCSLIDTKPTTSATQHPQPTNAVAGHLATTPDYKLLLAAETLPTPQLSPPLANRLTQVFDQHFIEQAAEPDLAVRFYQSLWATYHLLQRSAKRATVKFIAACLDADSHRLYYANIGDTHLFHYRHSRLHRLTQPNYWHRLQLTVQKIDLAAGEGLILATDAYHDGRPNFIGEAQYVLQKPDLFVGLHHFHNLYLPFLSSDAVLMALRRDL